ncbi:MULTISPECIES: MarR family winged helix-turn-helix transcriptional regulator [unclassified Enterococcus]|jgi:DNA-binding MarR family transcriptional regulator|uniref:MarR family winged helix-turn-helix transcriptional regulator n=1 Tax=unclassified Enterococcus TaxID=2608891 RepID=UPI000353EEF8|nr:transcriptional regulator, MarR family [Enterococcus faecalis 13-SD-W-01]
MSRFTDDLLKQLRFVHAASEMFMQERKEKFSGQQRVLVILKEEDGLIQSHLAEILDIRPSSLAELIKKMEMNETVYRVEDETDKRLKRVYLTEKGKEKAAEYNNHTQSEAFFAGLDKDEQEQFQASLTKIIDGWDPKFQQQSERFADPIDRLRQMQDLRQIFFEQRGEDWRNMSREERKNIRRKMDENWRNMSREDRKNLKKEMREEFRNMHRFGRNHHGGFPPNGSRPFPPFWQEGGQKPDRYDPKDRNQEPTEDDWKDF